MHNIPQNNPAETLKTIAAFIGAGTGSAALIYKMS